MRHTFRATVVGLGLVFVLGAGCNDDKSSVVDREVAAGMWGAELYQPKSDKRGLLRFRGRVGDLDGGFFRFGFSQTGVDDHDTSVGDAKGPMDFDITLDAEDMSFEFGRLLKANQKKLGIADPLPSAKDLNCWVIKMKSRLSNGEEWDTKGTSTLLGPAGGLSSSQTSTYPSSSNVPMGETRILAFGVNKKADKTQATVFVRDGSIMVGELDGNATAIGDYEPGAWAFWARSETP